MPQPPERPVAPPSVTDPAIDRAQRIANFVDYTATTYGVDPAHVRSVLAGAEHKQSIIDAMSRPAEAVRPWRDYRPIFINDARINGGVAFYRENRAALDRVAGRLVVDQLKDLAMRAKCAVVLSTHDERIFDVASRRLHIEDGRCFDVPIHYH